MKYQRHSSEESSLYAKAMEMVRLMKWARSCDTSCLEVSNTQIFQGLCGFSLTRFTISTEKDRIPSPSWISIPSSPVIEQLSPSPLSDIYYYLLNLPHCSSSNHSKANILLDLLAGVVEEAPAFAVAEVPLLVVLALEQRLHVAKGPFLALAHLLRLHLLPLLLHLLLPLLLLLFRGGGRLVVVGEGPGPLLYLFLLPPDKFEEVGVGKPAVLAVLEHEEKSVFDGVLVPALDEAGHP